jgi:hypothetical protein
MGPVTTTTRLSLKINTAREIGSRRTDNTWLIKTDSDTRINTPNMLTDNINSSVSHWKLFISGHKIKQILH